MINSSTRQYLQLLILLLVLGTLRPALAEQQAQEQGVMSDARDAIVESEWGQKKKRQFDELKERLDDRFVQPVARWREQLECSAGWRGDECEKMFPETRERIDSARESVQAGAGSMAHSARDLEARLEEQAGQARTGLTRLMETDTERAERANGLRALYLDEARKEDERIKARNARMIAEQQQMARKFAEEEARKRRAEQEESETLVQHESEVNRAVGTFLNILGAAAAQSARSGAYAPPAPRPAQTYNRPSGGGSGGSSGGSSSMCGWEEGIGPRRWVCR